MLSVFVFLVNLLVKVEILEEEGWFFKWWYEVSEVVYYFWEVIKGVVKGVVNILLDIGELLIKGSMF